MLNTYVYLILLLSIASACGGDHDQPKSPKNPMPHTGLQDQAPAQTEDGPFSYENAISVKSKKDQFEVFLIWEETPIAGMDAQNVADLVIKPKNANAKTIELSSLQPKMNCCGTKPVQKQTVKRHPEDTGRFLVSNIYFHAAGAENAWTLLIDAKIGDQTDRAELIIEKILPSK